MAERSIAAAEMAMSFAKPEGEPTVEELDAWATNLMGDVKYLQRTDVERLITKAKEIFAEEGVVAEVPAPRVARLVGSVGREHVKVRARSAAARAARAALLLFRAADAPHALRGLAPRAGLRAHLDHDRRRGKVDGLVADLANADEAGVGVRAKPVQHVLALGGLGGAVDDTWGADCCCWFCCSHAAHSACE